MKYSLRSLMIVAIIAPPLLAGGWLAWQKFWFKAPRQNRVIHTVIHRMPEMWDTATTEEEWAEAIEGSAYDRLPNSSAPAPKLPSD